MKKIDIIDKKILFELDNNSRMSISEISRKIGISKGSIINRIKKLEEVGVIKKYYTVIDSFKLGYICLRYVIKLQYAPSKTWESILKHFASYPNTWYFAEAVGKYDLLISIWIKDIKNFYLFWDNTLNKFNNYFQSWSYSIYAESMFFHHNYLIGNFSIKDRKVETIGYDKQIKIDDLEFNILKILSSNARIPIVQLAEELKSNVKTIKKRIKKLENLEIIKGYRINMDISKLGYNFFEVEMNIKDYNERNKIMDYISKHPNLIMIDKTISPMDIEFEYHIKDIDDLKNIIDEIINEFPDSIKNYDYFYFPKINILNYFPNK